MSEAKGWVIAVSSVVICFIVAILALKGLTTDTSGSYALCGEVNRVFSDRYGWYATIENKTYSIYGRSSSRIAGDLATALDQGRQVCITVAWVQSERVLVGEVWYP